jgi:HAD superfamily hydrolase (TIGR01509 family)
MRRSAVIFDMDGVLVDTEPIYIDIGRHLFRKLGIEVSQERIMSYVGVAAERMWAEIRRDFLLSQSLDELIQAERSEQWQRLSAMTLIPPTNGVVPFLKQLMTAGIRRAIASSTSLDLVQLIISKAMIGRYFEAVISGDQVKEGKPAPDIFLCAASELGCAPSECVVVEDSPHGIRGAKRAGMKTVGFANQVSRNLDLSEADMVITDFATASVVKIMELMNPPSNPSIQRT